jgi:hypothetical protein
MQDGSWVVLYRAACILHSALLPAYVRIHRRINGTPSTEGSGRNGKSASLLVVPSVPSILFH